MHFKNQLKYITSIILVILLNYSCKKESFNISNLNGNQITILGHGGMGIGQTYPMNSFESIQKCLYLGADGTEIDVQMTKDSILVAFHDKKLEDATNLSGQIYTKTWNEICKAQYRDPIYSSYKIISLDDLFSHLKNVNQYIFYLDCKNFKPDDSKTYENTFNNALIRIIDKYKLEENVYIESKKENLIKSLQSKRPNLRIFIYKEFDTALKIAKKYQLDGITTAVNEISKRDIKEAHDNGIMIAVFNTHSGSRNSDAIRKNVDFIQTDKLKDLIKKLK